MAASCCNINMAVRVAVALIVVISLVALIVGIVELVKHNGRRRPPVAFASSMLNISLLSSGRVIPETLFGIFFEEINHAGAGGLWAELVSNRGFEAGGTPPSDFAPWSVIGDKSSILVSTDLSSCFRQNPVALRLEILQDIPTGVGIYNPGFWGMNIEKGKPYKVVFHVRSLEAVHLSISLASSSSLLATKNVSVEASKALNWTKIEVMLQATESDPNSRLQLTTIKKGVFWFDQVSVMPVDTYKGHGFRKDIFQMLLNLEPRFLRFPGGTSVEGLKLRNAFRWKETIGPWEERPGHFGDAWNYWTDDGLGYFELLLLAEDLGATPVWVINNGISREEEVETKYILPFVQEMLDSIDFARGDPSTAWGSVRAAMGHPHPFSLRYLAIGNEDCQFQFYRGNYLEFYHALKRSYPDIKVISNCEGTYAPLDHPADLYDVNRYPRANPMFSLAHLFDGIPRSPKAFVSEYAVRDDAGNGNLLAAIAEAAFLIGIEHNSDLVEMACYFPLLVHTNDRRWMPGMVVFNSSHLYGTPSYWMQHFFTRSSGATLLDTKLQADSSALLVASAIKWKDAVSSKSYITIKIVNFKDDVVNLTISIKFDQDSVQLAGSKMSILTSTNVTEENSFENPRKVSANLSRFDFGSKDTYILLHPYSLTAIDLLQEERHH